MPSSCYNEETQGAVSDVQANSGFAAPRVPVAERDF
jgi:hypothetical protein